MSAFSIILLLIDSLLFGTRALENRFTPDELDKMGVSLEYTHI